MKYVKAWLLAAISITALLVLAEAGTASATVFCKKPGEGSPTGTVCPKGSDYEAGSAFHAILQSQEEPLTLDYGVKEGKCPEATLKGKTSNEGEQGQGVSTFMEVMTFIGCPSCEITVLKAGTVTVDWISGTHNGTLTSSGTEITMRCVLSLFGAAHCIYVTESTHLGTLIGGSPAVLALKASLPSLPTDSLCSEAMTWEGNYTVTEPSGLYAAGHT